MRCKYCGGDDHSEKSCPDIPPPPAKRNDGGSAFPREDYQTDDARGQRGMSLRDYFAAKAMAAIIDSDFIGGIAEGSHESALRSVAGIAYAIADAMLKMRES